MNLKFLHVQANLVLVTCYKQLHVKTASDFTFVLTLNSFQNFCWCFFGVIWCCNRNQKIVVFILLPFKLKDKIRSQGYLLACIIV